LKYDRIREGNNASAGRLLPTADQFQHVEPNESDVQHFADNSSHLHPVTYPDAVFADQEEVRHH
jgi:hypothetical protein